MSAPVECSELSGLGAPAEEALAADRLAAWERHLETCPACQERLDRDCAAGEALLAVARRIGDPTVRPVDPTLDAMLSRLRGSGGAPAEDQEPIDLSFLRPSDRPESLGQLGDYEVTEVLGQGGMGTVLKAFDPSLQRWVAIKVMSAALAGVATARRRFIREARAAAAGSHDNLVSVFSVHEAGQLPYLVMQYVPGESLQARLDRAGPLGLEEILEIGAQAARGLAAAHARGLIHRDVKPANILLESASGTSPEKAKITDFGLARTADDVQLTQEGVVAGTPEYMAPEQARGEAVDHRADLFSLGGVLYALCTGRPPFTGTSTVALLRQVSDAEPLPVRSLNPAIPVWLEELIERLMDKNPAERFQSAAEVATLLEGFRTHLRAPATVQPPVLPPSKKRGESRWGLHWWLLLLLALLAVGAGSLLLQATVPPEQKAQEPAKEAPTPGRVTYDLRLGIDRYPALALHGPDVEEITKAEPQGVRMTLVEGHRDTRPVRLELKNRMRGDFDVVLHCELLAVGRPLPQYGAGILLHALFDSPDSAIVSLFRKPQGLRFAAHKLEKQPDGKNKYVKNVDVPAGQTRVRLRLKRVGTALEQFAAEEGLDFKKLQTVEIGSADLTLLRAECSTMYTPIALDARFSELTVEGDVPNRAPETVVAEPVIPPPPTAAPRSWLTAVLVIGGALALVAGASVALGLVLTRRRSVHAKAAADAPTAAPQPIPLACSGCGKKLRVKAETAGKKVKCPQCGVATVVPEPE